MPDRAPYSAVIDAISRPMCCPGCAAVAQTIADAGLSDYYRARQSTPGRQALPDDVLADLEIYDAPAIQKSFVSELPDDGREASLMLEGVRCAACVWLIEHQVGRLPGVQAVSVNYTTARMHVRWDTARLPLSRILKSVSDIGYKAEPFDASRREVAMRQERRSALWHLGLAGFCMMQVMMFAVPAYLAPPGDISPDVGLLMRWASLLLTLPVMLISAGEFFRGAWRDLRRGRIGMDMPVALGLGTAFAASVWATVSKRGDVYFDSITMFVFLLLAARFLEQQGRALAGRTMGSIGRLLPAKAQKLVDYPHSSDVVTVAVAALAADDLLVVKAGERLPADGLVVEGRSEADEALITGESRSVPKQPGDPLTGGSVNLTSPLVMRVTRVGADTVVAQIGRLMERALAEKPAIARLADRAAAWFVLGLLLATCIAAAIWWRIDPDRVIPVVIALLVVTCPCALGLATPTALAMATSRMARRGLLVTRGHALETLARATDFVFDKTGTLTIGKPQLVDIVLLGPETRDRAIAIAAALEARSEHPLGKALRGMVTQPIMASGIVNRPGAGIEAEIDGITYRLGTLDFAAALGPGRPTACDPENGCGTLVALRSLVGWIALFRFADTTRPQAAATIAALKRSGKRVHLLSGDTASATASLARQLGIEHVRAAATPTEKLAYVRELQASGAVVAMVGDGVNDAPVLGGAQVSVAMGSGTNVAQAAADILLLSSDLGALTDGIAIATKTRTVIRQNLLWALAYNVVAIPLAMAGLVTPWVAAIGMSGSSALVVLNALRIARNHATGTNTPALALADA